MRALGTLLVTASYAAAGLAAAWLVRRARSVEVRDEEDLPPVTVVVPARDEEDHLPACLAALAQQDYPAGRLHVLVADDGSTDRTAEVAQRAGQRLPSFRLLAVPQDGPLHGKARALAFAFGHAQHEHVVLTDADCTPPPAWLRGMVSALQERGTGVVCGVAAVPEGGDLRQEIQRLDWLLLLTVAGAWSLAGRPLTGMGNAMALRRSAYEEVGGYTALPFSVTEDYQLFQAIDRRPRWRAELRPDAALRTGTAPLPTLREVFDQRKRWARGGLLASPAAWLFYGLVLGIHALPLWTLPRRPRLGLLALGVKTLTDAAVLHVGARRLEVAPPTWRGVLALEGWLHGYLLALPASLLLAPQIRWKGRTHR